MRKFGFRTILFCKIKDSHFSEKVEFKIFLDSEMFVKSLC